MLHHAQEIPAALVPFIKLLEDDIPALPKLA